MILYLTIIIVSLILSFYFSGTETAFVSVNRVRVELWRRNRMRVAEIILGFLKKPEKLLYTTLVGNNIFNVAFASYATVYFNNYFDPGITWLLILFLTLFIGEIIPKTIFRSLADWVVRWIAYPLNFFYYLFFPFIWLVSKISESILRSVGLSKSELKSFFSKKDIEILIQESQGMMSTKDMQEKEILGRVLHLREMRVRDAMVPRTDIVAVPEDISIRELIKIFQKSGHTKLPVYQDNLDNIIGVVFMKDLFFQPRSVQEIIRPILMVPETKRASELLKEFRENNVTIAIVIDEYGGTAGLVTNEDLMEELFGEIEDEYDFQEVLYRQIAPKTYSVSARIEIERLNEALGLDLPEGDYETLGGFLLCHMGHIPRREEVFEYRGIRFVITKATRRKIEWVKIILP